MKWLHVTYVESESKPGKEYEIKKHPVTGQLGCSCESYRFSKGLNKTCKHLPAFSVARAAEIARPHPVTDVVTVTLNEEKFTFRRAISFGSLV